MRILISFITLFALGIGVTIAQVGNNQEVLNPNLASKDDLAALPGMTSESVESIVVARPFASNGALLCAAGDLGDEQAAFLEKCFVPINLNSAPEEEIMLVPGMSGRMAHEFEEYRPYASIEQFRGEIGKYVDDDEVARFEQYVFVPLDINTASEEDLGSIPGITPRMVHEFEEYRPYTSMEQFRREIGKYVDDDEVARLERYVEIR